MVCWTTKRVNTSNSDYGSPHSLGRGTPLSPKLCFLEHTQLSNCDQTSTRRETSDNEPKPSATDQREKCGIT